MTPINILYLILTLFVFTGGTYLFFWAVLSLVQKIGDDLDELLPKERNYWGNPIHQVNSTDHPSKENT